VTNIARIAVVEDDPKAQRMLINLIERSGYNCVGHFGDAESAVESLPALKPDIVLMDIELPEANGITCLRRVQPKLPDTHFLMVTSYEDSQLVFDALASGAVGYLLKRSAPKDLAKAMQDVLEGGSPMTSSIARKVVQSFHPASRGAPELDLLSPRERHVLQLLAEGMFYKEIADTLNISLNTVHSYIRRIYQKLHVHSRMEAVAKIHPR
jgi:DNA-binding NarL/FixJ family response regulator